VAAAVWPDTEAAVAATVVPAGRVDPVDAWVEPYRELCERFRALYPALHAWSLTSGVGDDDD